MGKMKKPNSKDSAYKEKCANKVNFDRLLHTYFNQPNLLNVIYKKMRAENKYCFLHEIGFEYNKEKPLSDIQNTDIIFRLWKNDKGLLLDVKLYIATEIALCRNKLMAIPFSFGQHANILIVDNAAKTVEHFEPHGDSYLEPNIPEVIILTAAMELTRILFPEYTYIPPIQVCPNFGFQKKHNEVFRYSLYKGACTIWSMWYAYLRLSNPDKPKEEILAYALDKVEGEKKDFSGMDDFIIQLIHAFISKTTLERNEMGIPVSANKRKINYYIGPYKNGLPHGIGEMNKVDGSKYQGEFKNGIPDGLGILRYVNGRVYKGSFINGVTNEGKLIGGTRQRRGTSRRRINK